jgi:iron-sulfur cluster insertion protein
MSGLLNATALEFAKPFPMLAPPAKLCVSSSAGGSSTARHVRPCIAVRASSAYIQRMTTPSLSESAARRVAALKTRQGNPGLMLRLSVDGGGCSGFQYKFGFDEAASDDDIVVERDGVKMVVDSVSLPFLEGAVVDYVETLGAAAFQVRNPQATASCGCGSSFAV